MKTDKSHISRWNIATGARKTFAPDAPHPESSPLSTIPSLRVRKSELEGWRSATSFISQGFRAFHCKVVSLLTLLVIFLYITRKGTPVPRWAPFPQNPEGSPPTPSPRTPARRGLCVMQTLPSTESTPAVACRLQQSWQFRMTGTVSRTTNSLHVGRDACARAIASDIQDHSAGSQARRSEDTHPS